LIRFSRLAPRFRDLTILGLKLLARISDSGFRRDFDLDRFRSRARSSRGAWPDGHISRRLRPQPHVAVMACPHYIR
jgi:hypothetical protein